MAENWSAIDADVRAGLAGVGNTLTITRKTPGTVDPANPGIPVAPIITTEIVPQFGEGSGQFRKGETVVTTDFEFMIAVPKTLVPKIDDMVTAGGVSSEIVKIEPFPAGGQPIYYTIWCNS